MRYKKRSNKKRDIGKVTFILILIIILGIFFFKKPEITGKIIQGKETIFSENLNLQVNESGTYEWSVKNPGSIKSLKLSGSVSSNGTARVYIEKNGTRQMLFDSTKQLFDVNIHVLPEYKSVFHGDKVLIQNVLFNLRGFGAGDINVRYSIKDSKGNVVATEEEIVYIETQAKFIRELIIPPEIEAGVYTAFVEAFSNSTNVGTGSDTFEIKAKYQVPYHQLLKPYLISIAVVIALAIAFILGIYGLRKMKKKQKIAELKEKVPLERIKKLKEELKALEKGYKSKFISEQSYKREKERIEAELRRLKK